MVTVESEAETDETEKPEGKKRIGSVGRKSIGATPGMIRKAAKRGLNRQTVHAGRALRLWWQTGTGVPRRRSAHSTDGRAIGSQTFVFERRVGRHGAGALASGFSPRRRVTAWESSVATRSAAKKFCAIIRAANSAIASKLRESSAHPRFSGDALSEKSIWGVRCVRARRKPSEA
ncbi:hypothetical protein QCE42_00930 [Caballeronia sp. LZ050]|uniref:hypothetical protein n=1 Tax=Caballeronia sp. LZ050 TaxID=3038570 RepID=UPI002862CC93|nr:hypothetical protein [Caballeronia sp. LZ050]MDR5853429.1 hypothetical protein [Caballeronia sp. LZ050]